MGYLPRFVGDSLDAIYEPLQAEVDDEARFKSGQPQIGEALRGKQRIVGRKGLALDNNRIIDQKGWFGSLRS